MKAVQTLGPAFLLFAALLLPKLAMAQAYDPSLAACGSWSDSRIEIGNGVLKLGESTFTRKGEKKDMGDGWFEARYAHMAEGEAQPDATLRLKITPQKVWLVDANNGASVTASRCP